MTNEQINIENINPLLRRSKVQKIATILLFIVAVICILLNLEIAKFDFEHKDKILWIFDRYTPTERLILYGDNSKKTKSEQQKAIWKHSPDNKIYLANYIVSLLDSESDRPPDWRKKIFSALKIAKQIDPDNAFYYYLSAGLLIEEASILKHDHNAEKKCFEYTIKIKNRKLLGQAVEKYLKGTQKKYFKTYSADLLQERLNIMGKPDDVLENIRQISIAWGTLPYWKYLKNTVWGIWTYAEVLEKEGKQQQALKMVAPWEKYFKQIIQESNFHMDILISSNIAGIAKQKIPEIYRKAGKITLAENAERKLKKIVAARKQWGEKAKVDDEGLNKAGIAAGFLSVTHGQIDLTDREFAINRQIEYIAIEKFIIIYISMFILVIVSGGFLFELYELIRNKPQEPLLIPPIQQLGKIFLLGVILPLFAIYWILNIPGTVNGYSSFSSKMISIAWIVYMIPVIIMCLANKYIKQRCLELNISSPPKWDKPKKIWLGILLLSFLGLIIPISLPAEQGYYAILAFLGLYVALGFIFLIKYYRNQPPHPKGKYHLYHMTFSTTMSWTFAFVAIFLSMVVVPFLSCCEANLISKDKLIYGHPQTITPLEGKIVQKLKSSILKAMEGLRDGRPTFRRWIPSGNAPVRLYLKRFLSLHHALADCYCCYSMDIFC